MKEELLCWWKFYYPILQNFLGKEHEHVQEKILRAQSGLYYQWLKRSCVVHCGKQTCMYLKYIMSQVLASSVHLLFELSVKYLSLGL